MTQNEHDFPPAFAAGKTAEVICTRCGHAGLRPGHVSTAFWHETGLVVIQDIPAFICPSCAEEFISDDIALGLDQMRGAGFPAERIVDRIDVPVFRFTGGGGT